MIDPRIWDSQQVMQLSPESFKTFIYLISQADDAGKLPVCWQMMATRIFPFDTVPTDKLKEIVTGMDKDGLIILYSVAGKDFIKHPNWTRYQKIDRPSASTLPDPEHIVERSSKTRRRLVRNGIEVKLNEVKLTGGEDAISEADKSLYHSVEKAFLSKNDNCFSDYKKEGNCIHSLIRKAKNRNATDPAAMMKAMLAAFWKLKSSDTSAKGFWRGQPFLPSALSPLWDRVLETMREDTMSPEVAAIINGGDV